MIALLELDCVGQAKLRAESPNERGSWEMLPFMTLSQVSQHREHFPRTQVPTGGENPLVYFCANTCTHERIRVSRGRLQLSRPFPKPGLSVSCFMYLRC